MLDRMKLLGLATVGVLVVAPAARSHASVLSPLFSLTNLSVLEDGPKKGETDEKDEEHEKGGKHEEKGEHGEKGEHDEEGDHEWKHKEMSIEQAVPMNMVPAPVMDAVKKELPNGTVTEAELEAKKHKIVYSFDVTSDNIKYDVKISVDGKFISKKVDDEKDEKDEKAEKGEKPKETEKQK